MLNENRIRILYIDLTDKAFRVEERGDLFDWLGGIGIATKLFSELVQSGADPFDPGQPIIFAIGPLTTIFPLVTKTVAVFRSPLTGHWGESYAGMRLAYALRFAGYDAVVVTGAAGRLAYAVITPEGVEFKDARRLRGLSTEETGRILREAEPGRGHRSTIRIGPSGERRVCFAGVNVDTYRHFGRMGLGAVMGAKNLKALVVSGAGSYPITDPKAYRKAYEEIYNRAVKTEIMDKYHGLGTPANVVPLNELGALPTRNLQSNRFEKAEAVSGEAFARENLVRKLACTGCPVGCIHVGLFRREFAEDYEYETVTLAYDHELIFALGTFLGIGTREGIFSLIEKVELLGLDAISSGVILGWMTEALEKGLITEEQVGAHLAFGAVEPYLEALDRLVEQPNELYATLAKGLSVAVERFGGSDFACLLGGHEMAGYHTGYGFVLGQTVGGRHSHLCNAGYALDQEHGILADPDGMMRRLVSEEKWRQVLNSLCLCLFARNIYDEPTTEMALQSVGIEVSEERLKELGDRIFNLKLETKKRLGFKPTQVQFPKRYLETPTFQGQLKEEVLRDLHQRYLREIGEY
ncbi:MAG: aldehyde ferredoxin oxidoreductase N-terminal domain-containing protein [Eubacteriales bacterium]|jgi:aldehyde:ferredoxin oxidoreductase|nr:aldehyde:ferredoxin oxidoreductase [Bacillota bacterium]MBV1727067.1 aldehyde:ferredoxin oxidoreductase [Desulforudis sp.]MDQ7789404.1 aldehyde ferredoxin oxidoreductase N-terminal domain-containing protein [Clostridia bacterium]MDZ4042325.1 aldehyde ferredoxin oxidoreductase N-terminal domain-containing protein [Eubacteriales bacterium]MBU4533121.1 aldehyde:ferredoxin oxidoreductase [Bacillota bacterium]